LSRSKPRRTLPDQSAAAQARWSQDRAGEQPTANGPEHFGARMRWARLRAGMPLRALTALGMSEALVRRLEAGQEPTITQARDLAQALGVSRDWLTDGTEQP